MSNSDLALLGTAVLGYIWQWARSFQRVPNWVSWIVMGLAAVAVYVWITPTVVTDWHESWRTAIAACISFILSARGAAAVAKESKSVPPTNSL